MGSGSARVTFGGAKQRVGERALEISEGGSVNGVNDDWRLGVLGRPSAQDSRLAGVRVHDMGRESAKAIFPLRRTLLTLAKLALILLVIDLLG